jgi:hypothetical protein
LDQNVLSVKEEEVGEGAGEDAAEQLTNVNRLSRHVTTVERLVTMAIRRRRLPRAYRWPDEDDDMAGRKTTSDLVPTPRYY